MIDLEEIDLSATPGTSTSARKIRAGKKNFASTRTRYSQLEAVTGISTW